MRQAATTMNSTVMTAVLMMGVMNVSGSPLANMIAIELENRMSTTRFQGMVFANTGTIFSYWAKVSNNNGMPTTRPRESDNDPSMYVRLRRKNRTIATSPIAARKLGTWKLIPVAALKTKYPIAPWTMTIVTTIPIASAASFASKKALRETGLDNSQAAGPERFFPITASWA